MFGPLQKIPHIFSIDESTRMFRSSAGNRRVASLCWWSHIVIVFHEDATHDRDHHRIEAPEVGGDTAFAEPSTRVRESPRR